MDLLGARRIGRRARYDSLNVPLADSNYHRHRHPPLTFIPNIPMGAPPHRIIPGDHHQQYWQDGGQKPPVNPFYFPSLPHGILPGFETNRLARVSTRSLISDNQGNNGISLGGTLLSENCERGRSGLVDNQAVFNQGSDQFPLHRESSFRSGDPNPALVSWRSFEFEQDRSLMESREWRFGRRLGLWDRRERSFHDPSVEPLAFETASLAAEPPSLNPSRGLCSAGSVSSLVGDASTASTASTVFEHGLPPLLLSSSGLYFCSGEVAEGTDSIENSHVIGSGPCPQWVKPMCSRTSSTRDVPSDQVFHRRHFLGHRTVNKSDPMYISTEDSIRWTYNTQRKTPNLRSMVDGRGSRDDGSMNKRGKTKVSSDRNANFYSRCAEQPIQKPSAFSRIQSSISVWERLEKKPLSPCSSPSAFSSPRNSNENQAEVDTPDLPFKSDALVAEVIDPLTAEPSLITKDISVVKTKRVVKKKKMKRKNEVIPIVPGLLESSKNQVISRASCLSSPTNDSVQSEKPVKAATSCCLLGESSISGCCAKKVKKLAVVSRNEAKEAIETVIQLEGCVTGMAVVEDEPKFEDDKDNVKEKNCHYDVVLGSETIEDSNLQLSQQGQMRQMAVTNDFNTQNITKNFSQAQDLATEILDDSVEEGLMVAQKLCNSYEHPVISEALTSSNVYPQSSDPFLPLRELQVNNDAAHECCPNVGNTGAANTIQQGKTEMEGIMTFAHFKMEKDGHHQEVLSPKHVVSGDAEVSAASRTCDDLPDFNRAHGKAERTQQMFSCTSTEHFEVLGVDVSSQSCVQGLQSHSALEISNSILKQDFPNEDNFEENNELHFSGCNLLPQSCCVGAFQDNLVIDASSGRMGHSLSLEPRKMEAPCKHFKNVNYQPKLSESENFNNCIFCGEEDQKPVDKEETLVLSLVSLGSDPDDQLGKSTRHNQLMSNKTQDLMSQDLKKKLTCTKLADENFSLKTLPNQGMVPRFLPNSKIFFGSIKNTGRTSQIGRHRTWVRTNKPSLNLDANLQQPGGNSTKQVPETQFKVQNSAYIRKGNSLIRKHDEPSPMLPPPIDASGITLKSNTERSSVCESRLECIENAASSYSFVERPKTPPLPHSKFTDFSVNANNSFPLPKSVDGRPELISDQCKQHGSQHKDLHSCNLESQEVKGYIRVETINSKRINYVKCKMNQLIVAPELEIDKSSKFSTETSQITVQHPDERLKAIPVSSSHVYYRRKRNQLVLNASSSAKQQAGVPIGNSNSVDHSKQNSSVKSRIVFQKEKRAEKSSLVGILGGFRRSHKIIGTLHHQGVLPYILPWKRLAKRKSFLKTAEPLSRSSSLSLISQKLQHLRKRNTIYTVSTDGFSIQKAGVVSIGGSSLKWSKSIEKRSKKASEEATMAVAEVERKKRERKRRKGTCGNGKNKVVLPCRSTSNCVLKQDDNSSSLPSQQSGNKNRMPFVPSRLFTGNDEYIRIGTGNKLVRDTNNIKRIIASEKVRWSLHTARLRLARKRQYCLFFTRFGKCKNFGGKCPFLHDTSKVAICTKFLKGQCSDNNCKLTHKVIPERMQDCSYFLKGLCTIENCHYRHVKVNANAPLCDGFLRGHCDDGDECHKKHSYTCPLFEATGKCPQGNLCKLHHPKAHSKSRKRKRAKLQSSSQGRYFCSSIDKTVEPLRVVSGEVLKGVDDIFLSDGRFTEYISLDVYSDTGCIGNDSCMEFDSKYCDLKSSDIDELLKPVGIMNMEDLTIF